MDTFNSVDFYIVLVYNISKYGILYKKLWEGFMNMDSTINTDIAVSIICNAYNHEKYIAKALQSFVMQKTDFAFEVLVHDDASTDNTAKIIKEYEEKYPDLIKAIYQTENQYSKGHGIVGKIQWGRAKGKYIAMCEGDDYWTDPLKLQKQYDALEAHPEVDICAHCCAVVNAKTNKLLQYLSPADERTILTVEQVIEGDGGYVSTNSLMYRSKINENLPEFRKFYTIDYTLQIYGALRGGMLYIPDCMGVYHYMVKGSWTSAQANNKIRAKNHLKKVIDMLEILDKETDYKYTVQVTNVINYYELRYYLSDTDTYKKAKEPKYRDSFKKLAFKERLCVNLQLYFPWVLNIWKKIKGKK